MTNSNEGTALETASDDYAAPDWLLGLFVHAANASEMSMGVTLTVGGTLVSGSLIGLSEYERLFVETVQAASPDFAEGMKQVFAEGMKQREAQLAALEAAGQQPPDARFIHLRNAHVIMGEEWTPASLWRARLDSVDGWSIGSIGKG